MSKQRNGNQTQTGTRQTPRTKTQGGPRDGGRGTGKPRSPKAQQPAKSQQSPKSQPKRQPVANEQYFSAAPSSEDVRRTLTVTIRGVERRVEVSNGVFSGNRVDLGTSVLLKQAPEPPAEGTFLDIGCGWGPVAIALAQESPEAKVWAIDVNERAIELTNKNAEAAGLNNVTATTADGVPADARFDVIWSNPPIRVGKDVLHDLLMAWLPRLNPGGAAYLVVQKNLGADSLIPWLANALGEGYAVSKYHSAKGYRVIEVAKEPKEQ